jgi:hypothetical protein
MQTMSITVLPVLTEGASDRVPAARHCTRPSFHSTERPLDVRTPPLMNTSS